MSSKYECSFCGKGDDEVAVLVAGPGKIFICDECIQICVSAIFDQARRAVVVDFETDPADGAAA